MDYYSLNFTFYDLQQQQLQVPEQYDFYLYNNYTQSVNIFSNTNAVASAGAGAGATTTTFSTLKTLVSQILIGIILYSLTIWTIIGNIFVWIALCTNRQLKQGGMSNYLIGNLALSDLLLGLTVLPFSATFSTLNNWVFGKFLCDIWLSIDVLCCTASIWGLLVIAIDRYIATNHPILYRKQKNSLKIAIIYCTISWIVSLAISIPPFVHDLYDSSVNNGDDLTAVSTTTVQNMLGHEHVAPATPKTKIISKNLKLINDNFYECVLYYKPSFVIASSMGSFYLPLILMILLYSKVFIRIKQQSNLFKHNNSSSISKRSRKIRKKLLELNNNATVAAAAAAAATATAANTATSNTQLITTNNDSLKSTHTNVTNDEQSPQQQKFYECEHQQTIMTLLDETKCKNNIYHVNNGHNQKSCCSVGTTTTTTATSPPISNSNSPVKTPTGQNSTCFLTVLINKTKHAKEQQQKQERNTSVKLNSVDYSSSNAKTTELTTVITNTGAAVGTRTPKKSKNSNGASSAQQHSSHHPASISRSETRVTKTLAIIIGCFILCWAPFFTAYIIRSQLSDANQISPLLMDIFIWLGYFNSSLNPILYAILNNNFRTAFKDILACRCFKRRRGVH